MWRILRSRLRAGRATVSFPGGSPPLPDRFRALPQIHPERCPESCEACAAACPTDAISAGAGSGIALDLGRCIFCTACQEACPEGAIAFGSEYPLASTSRPALVRTGCGAPPPVRALEGEMRRLLGRSLRLRQVSAGGCNGCEAEVNVLGSIVYDLSRFGIEYVASPRHADGLIVTGPVTRNMRQALLDTWRAVPDPKLLIAVGACAIAGGPFAGHPEVESGVDGLLPVDLYVPGCPPHPLTLLDGLLRLMGRVRESRAAQQPTPRAAAG